MPAPDQPAYLGQHLLFDFYGVTEKLDDCGFVQAACEAAARATGATVLGAHFHPFGAGLGVSGVVLLAESHLSVHTWPEFGMATFDIYVCGACQPHAAVDVLAAAFAPTRSTLLGHLRGQRE